MPKRKPTDRVTLTLRLKEPLRIRLETIARESEISLNSEIVRRLEQSIRDEDAAFNVFGDRDTFRLATVFAFVINYVERDNGGKVRDNPEILKTALEITTRFLLYDSNSEIPQVGNYIDTIVAGLVRRLDTVTKERQNA